MPEDMSGSKTEKYALRMKEHFIISNLKKKLVPYLLMWALAVFVSWIMTLLPITQPVTDYSGMRAFSTAFIMITTTTITFAVPTCLNSILGAYEEYRSTKIREILLERFPATLLLLSAFTSLLLSIMIVSGIIGIAIDVSSSFVFYLALYWTLVCVFYLFVALEKMMHFTFHAPYAIIDKLEYGVFKKNEIHTKQEYDEFRSELASINDIASTLMMNSTGQDEAITKTLILLYNIHKHYLTTADKDDIEQFRYHLNACRSVDHEIVRLFRSACSSKNELAVKNVLQTYCAMLANAAKTDTGIGYFADMVEQVQRFQSYAASTYVNELKNIAYVDWFFMFFNKMSSSETKTNEFYRDKLSILVRTMSTSLRTASLEHDDAVLLRFMRIVSNSNIEYDILSLAPVWKILLDRTIFVYSTWLLDAMPDNAKECLEYIRRYSMVNTDIFRSALPDSGKRLEALFAYESLSTFAIDNIDPATTNAKRISTDQTALMMSISLEDKATHTLTMLSIVEHANLGVEDLTGYGDKGRKLLDEIRSLSKKLPNDKELQERVKLAKVLSPGIEQHIDYFSTVDEWHTV